MEELRKHIDDYHDGNAAAFARLVGVRPLEVYRWLRGSVKLPGYIKYIMELESGL